METYLNTFIVYQFIYSVYDTGLNKDIQFYLVIINNLSKAQKKREERKMRLKDERNNSKRLEY